MKTIAIHSYKGGVGKTTVALLLAKYAALERRKVCVLDFDFLGAGMSDLFKIARRPERYLEHFLLAAEPHGFALESLLGEYRDSELDTRSLALLLNLSESPDPTTAEGRKDAETQLAMHREVASEERYGEIGIATRVLLDKLAAAGYDLAVIDCHPGLEFVSAALRPLADLNVFVTTPNRSDCFGLLKALNLKGLYGEKTFLVVNHAEPRHLDFRALGNQMKDDPIKGMEAGTILAHLEARGMGDRHFAVIPESEALRRLFLIGGTGELPQLGRGGPELQFCNRILTVL